MLKRTGVWHTPILLLTAWAAIMLSPQASSQAAKRYPLLPISAFSEADQLRGSYGPYRANNDLLYYHLDVRVDPDKQYLSGKNSIRFKMLTDGRRIQLDLVPAFQIDKILLNRATGAPLTLHYERAAGRTVYVDFPKTLRRSKSWLRW